jgi:hypothetical protein
MIKTGEMIRVKSNLSGHNYTIGNIYKIIFISGKQYKAIDLNNKIVGNYISEDDFFLIFTKENQIEKITKMENAINEIQKKKSYLKEKDLQQSDIRAYNISILLSIANSDLNEKTKMENMQKYINEM